MIFYSLMNVSYNSTVNSFPPNTCKERVKTEFIASTSIEGLPSPIV